MSIGRHTAALDPQVPADPSPPTAAAVLAWTAARDAALRGLVHALSNRVGTVAAAAAMLDGDPPPAASVGTAARVLAGEGERLEALLAHLRLATGAPLGDGAPAEPLHVPELVGEVCALAAAAGWDVAAGDCAADTPPAYAPRAAAAHALLVLAHGAGAGVGSVVLEVGAEGGAAVVRARAGARPTSPAVVPPDGRAACAWLLGDAAAAEAGALRLPPLDA